MANGSINNPYAVSSGTIQKNNDVSGTLDMDYCRKIGNIVTVSGRIYGIENDVANGTFFIIPTGFRPKALTRCTGYMNINGVGLVPMLCTIGTSGGVTFSYSNNATTTQVAFAGTYPI